MKYFELTISGSVSLTVDDVWPDGDAPENPTAADVEELIKRSGSNLFDVLLDWDIDEHFKMQVLAFEASK